MEEQVKIRLDRQDILNLLRGQVLYRERSGIPRGVGDKTTQGENPVEVFLTESDIVPLYNSLFQTQHTTIEQIRGSNS
jgi:hypothetical protein